MVLINLKSVRKRGLLGALLLLSTYAQAWDEDRESYFTPRFQQAIKEGDYCKAKEIAAQRLLDLKHPERMMPRSQMDGRHLRWLQQGKEAESKCRTSDWGVVAQQYQTEIQALTQELNTLRQLQQQFKVVLNASDISFDPQTGQRYVQLLIKNSSAYSIQGFVLDYRDFEDSSSIKGFNYPADLQQAAYPGQSQGQVFAAATEQGIKIQTSYAPELSGVLGRTGITVKQLTVIEGGATQVYDFANIRSLEKKIFELQQNLEYRR